MSPRSRDLLFLLGSSLAIGGCGAAVDDPNASGGTGDDGALLDDAIDACAPWAKKYVECYNALYAGEDYSLSYVAFIGYCISYFGYASTIGPACVDAMTEYHACIGALDCEEITGDGDGDGNQPCEAAAQAREEACSQDEPPSVSIGDSASDAGDFGDESTTDVGDDTTTGEPPMTTSDSSSSDGGESSSSG